jgi:hypothetical protein
MSIIILGNYANHLGTMRCLHIQDTVVAHPTLHILRILNAPYDTGSLPAPLAPGQQQPLPVARVTIFQMGREILDEYRRINGLMLCADESED